MQESHNTDIKTYPEMNAQIVSLLRIADDSPACLYAAKRIEELEAALNLEQGEWLQSSDGVPTCSACDGIALQQILLRFPTPEYYSKFVLSKYCPHCGARMDGEK